MARSSAEASGAGPYRIGDSASHLLHRAEQLASERFAQLVGDTITLRQFAVLAAIAEEPGVSQSQLVRATGVDRSTIAEMMARMEKRGWITRETSEIDARAVSVTVAPEGAHILAGATHHARAADAAILDLLPRTKRKSFLNTLTKLSKLSEEAAAKSERKAKRDAKRERKKKRSKAAGVRRSASRKQRG